MTPKQKAFLYIHIYAEELAKKAHLLYHMDNQFIESDAAHVIDQLKVAIKEYEDEKLD